MTNNVSEPSSSPQKPAFAARTSAIQPSATVAVAQRARELKASGKDVLSFSVGEPDFGTPKHIGDAAKAAIDRGETRYTAVKGIPALLDAICEDSARRRPGTDYTPKHAIVSVGAKHTLFNLSLALFEQGDEVIIPAPYWVSYPEQVALAGAKSVIVDTTIDDNFLLDPKKLEAAITPRTKAVVLCTPSNPTGSAYNAQQLQAIGDVLEKHRVWVIVDEIYGQLVYDGFEHVSLASLCPALRDRLLVVDGVSKSHAMTGWRIGWLLGPEEVVRQCDKLQGQSTTNPTSIAQHAAVAALRGPQDFIAEMKRAFVSRRDQLVAGMSSIPGVRCPTPQGAFYVFPNVEAWLGMRTPSGETLRSDLDVAQYLLNESLCAVVPGTAFGSPGHVRISYAVSNETIAQGLERMAQAAARLQPGG